jgi:hypothetical protein
MDSERGVSAGDGGEMIMLMEWKLKLERGLKNLSLLGLAAGLNQNLWSGVNV